MNDLLLTKNQQIVMQTFQMFPIHPSADELYALIHETHPKIGLASIYRTLKQLVAMGKIQKITGLDIKDHYDHTLGIHPHFICTECGSVQDVPMDLCPVCVERVEQEMNISCAHMELNIRGVCSKCQRK